jgi:hypothetical protein
MPPHAPTWWWIERPQALEPEDLRRISSLRLKMAVGGQITSRMSNPIRLASASCSIRLAAYERPRAATARNAQDREDAGQGSILEPCLCRSAAGRPAPTQDGHPKLGITNTVCRPWPLSWREAGLQSGLTPRGCRPATSTVQPTVEDCWLGLSGVVLAKRRSARQISGIPMALGRSQ